MQLYTAKQMQTSRVTTVICRQRTVLTACVFAWWGQLSVNSYSPGVILSAAVERRVLRHCVG